MPNQVLGPPAGPPFKSHLEAALHWHSRGFPVVPLTPDGREPEHLDVWVAATAANLRQYWDPRPDHGVGMILGEEAVALETRTVIAAIELRRLEREHGVPPLLVVVTPKGERHVFLREVGASLVAKSLAEDERHAAYIEVLTGTVCVALPPTVGCTLATFAPPRFDDLSVATGALLSAVQRHNDAPRRTALHRFSLANKADELHALALDEVHVLEGRALLGQATLIYAGPNIGKTLIVLFLLCEAIAGGRIDPRLVLYLDCDDTTRGLAEKARLADDVGFVILADGHAGFRMGRFPKLLEEVIEKGEARGAVIVLDTLKKFADLMDKRMASGFSELVRRFVQAGGTLIALAHVNKRMRDGRPVFAGTTDMVDDLDCAFVGALAPEHQQRPGERVILFENLKRRGDVAERAAFAYSAERGLSYMELLASVRRLDIEEFALDEGARADVPEAQVVDAVASCIFEGFTSKMRLRDAAAARAGISRRRALQVIERYTGDDPTRCRWTYSVRARGAKLFALLHQPEPPAAADCDPETNPVAY